LKVRGIVSPCPEAEAAGTGSRGRGSPLAGPPSRLKRPLLRAHQKVVTLEDPASFASWLYRIATNIRHDRFQESSSRDRIRSLDEEPANDPERGPPPALTDTAPSSRQDHGAAPSLRTIAAFWSTSPNLQKQKTNASQPPTPATGAPWRWGIPAGVYPSVPRFRPYQ
jgi:hypothetical protein